MSAVVQQLITLLHIKTATAKPKNALPFYPQHQQWHRNNAMWILWLSVLCHCSNCPSNCVRLNVAPSTVSWKFTINTARSLHATCYDARKICTYIIRNDSLLFLHIFYGKAQACSDSQQQMTCYIRYCIHNLKLRRLQKFWRNKFMVTSMDIYFEGKTIQKICLIMSSSLCLSV